METTEFYHIYKSIELHFEGKLNAREKPMRVRGASTAKLTRNKMFIALSAQISNPIQAVMLCSLCHLYRRVPGVANSERENNEWIVQYMLSAINQNDIQAKILTFSDIGVYDNDVQHIKDMIESYGLNEYLGLNPFSDSTNVLTEIKKHLISPESVIFAYDYFDAWSSVKKRFKFNRFSLFVEALYRYKLILGDTLCSQGKMRFDLYFGNEREKQKVENGKVQTGDSEWHHLFHN